MDEGQEDTDRIAVKYYFLIHVVIWSIRDSLSAYFQEEIYLSFHNVDPSGAQ